MLIRADTEFFSRFFKTKIESQNRLLYMSTWILFNLNLLLDSEPRGVPKVKGGLPLFVQFNRIFWEKNQKIYYFT